MAAGSPGQEQECRSEENRNAGHDRAHERPGVTLWTGGHHHADPERDDQQQEEENHEDHSELAPHGTRLSPDDVRVAERRSDMAARETSLLCCLWDLVREQLSALQARKCDLDEPADRSLGSQVAGGTEGMHAIGGEFINRNIVAEVAGIRDIG